MTTALFSSYGAAWGSSALGQLICPVLGSLIQLAGHLVLDDVGWPHAHAW